MASTLVFSRIQDVRIVNNSQGNAVVICETDGDVVYIKLDKENVKKLKDALNTLPE